MTGNIRKSVDDGDHVYQSLGGTQGKKLPLRPTFSCPSRLRARGLKATHSCPLQMQKVKDNAIKEENNDDYAVITKQPQAPQPGEMAIATQRRNFETSYSEFEVPLRSCCQSWSCLCCLHSILHHCIWEDADEYHRLS